MSLGLVAGGDDQKSSGLAHPPKRVGDDLLAALRTRGYAPAEGVLTTEITEDTEERH